MDVRKETISGRKSRDKCCRDDNLRMSDGQTHKEIFCNQHRSYLDRLMALAAEM